MTLTKRLFVVAVMAATCITGVAKDRPAADSDSDQVVLDYSDIAPFEGISISNLFRVELTRGEEFSVIVTADRRLEGNIDVKEQGGTLIVRLTGDNSGWRRKMTEKEYPKIKITMPHVRLIELSSVTELWGRGEFSLPYGRLEINLGGCSRIHGLKIAAQSLDATISGASSATISGEFREVEAAVDGASGASLAINSSKMDLRVSGASSSDISGEIGHLDAVISGTSRTNLDVKSDGVCVKVSGASSAKLSGSIGELTAESSGASSINTGNAHVGRIQIR